MAIAAYIGGTLSGAAVGIVIIAIITLLVAPDVSITTAGKKGQSLR